MHSAVIQKLLGEKKRPCTGQLEQHVRESAGSDVARDNVCRDHRRKEAAALVGRRIALKSLDDSIGLGRVAATSGKRSGR